MASRTFKSDWSMRPIPYEQTVRRITYLNFLDMKITV